MLIEMIGFIFSLALMSICAVFALVFLGMCLILLMAYIFGGHWKETDAYEQHLIDNIARLNRECRNAN